MKAYALDSNIISAMLKENEAIINRYEQAIEQGKVFIMPPIVLYEIQRGLLSKNMLKRLRSFERFCEDIEIGAFDTRTWTKAAEIYAQLSKQGKPVGAPYDGDIFIAAFCVINRYTLITSNTDHFERINGLSFENWGLQ